MMARLLRLLFRKTVTRGRAGRRCHHAAGLWEDVLQIGGKPLMNVCLEFLVHAVGIVRTAMLSGVASTAALAG